MRKISKLLILFLLICCTVGLSSARGQFLFFFDNPLLGKIAPDFTLDTVNQKAVNMTAYREGKSAIIYFWTTQCHYCREEIKKLQKEKVQIESQGIRLLTVDIGDSSREVQNYLKRLKIDLDVFIDTEGELSDLYAVVGVPSFYFIDQEGIVQAIEYTWPDNYQEILQKNSKRN